MILLFAQGCLVLGGLVAILRDLPSGPQGEVGLASVALALATVVVIALHFMALSAVQSGSTHHRVFASVLSAANFLFWFPQFVLWVSETGWLSLAISALAVTTSTVVWLRDPTAGAAGVSRPPRPLT